MILSTYVKLLPNNGNLIYKNFLIDGYYIIPISELKINSGILIDVKCDICDTIKNISYRNYNKNVNKHNFYSCSQKCSILKNKQTNKEKYGSETLMNVPQFKEKHNNTMKKLYGVEYALQNKDLLKKQQDTTKEKYGEAHIYKLDSFKKKRKNNNLEKYGVEETLSDENVRKKIYTTNLERYGDIISLNNEEIRNKIFATNLERYGGYSPTSSKEIREKITKTNLEKYGSYNYLVSNIFLSLKKDILNKKFNTIFEHNNEYNFILYDNYEFDFLHRKCSNKFKINMNNYYYRINNNICLCTECYPINEQKSIKEKEIVEYIKSLNIDFIEGDRSILEGKELDIYIPSKNIAIEFNGLYWHSELFKDKNYHLDKSLKCQEKGIQLLHIWEDEWIFKQNIVKSIIKNKLGLIDEKIYARQTEVRVVEDSKLVRKFLDENHIQGYTQSSIKIGLYYNNELVSLMTFGKRMIKKNIEFELIRFCNKLNTNVVGASSKLFKYFKSNYDFTDLISYSDFRLFDGKMYETLGFTKQHLSIPDYFWCKGLERFHRSKFMKHKLIKEGFDSTKTEIEIMHERGYYRNFGCGQYKWYFK